MENGSSSNGSTDEGFISSSGNQEVHSGQYKLELIEEPKDARLSLWEDDPQPEIKSGRDVLNRGFGIFSKVYSLSSLLRAHLHDQIQITRAISSNIQDEMAKTSISRVFMNEGQPELPLERPVVIRSTMVDEDDFRDYVLGGRYKEIKGKIFKGGLTGGARPFAWKQLLGYDSIKNPEGKKATKCGHLNIFREIQDPPRPMGRSDRRARRVLHNSERKTKPYCQRCH